MKLDRHNLCIPELNFMLMSKYKHSYFLFRVDEHITIYNSFLRTANFLKFESPCRAANSSFRSTQQNCRFE